MNSITKTCSHCHQDLPLECFYRDAYTACGLRSWCKECTRAAQRTREQTEQRKAYQKARQHTAEYIAYMNAYQAEYRKRPESIAYQKAYHKTYRKKWGKLTKYNEELWDWIEENVFMSDGHVLYNSIIWKWKHKPATLNFEKLLDIAEDNIYEDEEGNLYIDWYLTRKEFEKWHKRDKNLKHLLRIELKNSVNYWQ